MFRCRICGECCRGDQKVWLNPSDLQRLASHLGAAGSGALESRGLIVREAGEHDIVRPRLRFRLGPAGRSCPFLMNDLDDDGRLWGRCSLHGTSAKPLVCRLAPLARFLDLATGSEEWFEIPPVIGCPGWDEADPPPEGRPVPSPDLDPGLRCDLDGEAAYFRLLASADDEVGPGDPVGRRSNLAADAADPGRIP